MPRAPQTLFAIFAALLIPSLASAQATADGLKIVLTAKVEGTGKSAGAIEREIPKDTTRVRQILGALKHTVEADPCAHHDVELKLIASSEGWGGAPDDLLELGVVLFQAGVPVGFASERSKRGLRKGMLQRVLTRALSTTKIERPPAGATKDRGLACRAAAAGKVYGEPAATRTEAQATADCAKKDAAACFEAGLLARDAALKANDRDLSCTKPSDLFGEACTMGNAHGCMAMAKNLGRCFKPEEHRDVRMNAYNQAAELGIPQACPGALDVSDFSAASVRASCAQIAVRAKPEIALDFYSLACELGLGSACGELGQRFKNGAGVPQSLDAARLIASIGCKAGDRAACALATPPAVVKEGPRPTPRPAPTVYATKLTTLAIGLGGEIMSPRELGAIKHDKGYGGSFFIQGMAGRVNGIVGFAGDFDVQVGFAQASGLILDSRMGVGAPFLWKAARLFFMPRLGVGLGGVGVFSDAAPGKIQASYTLSAYVGGILGLSFGPVGIEGHTSAAIVWGRDVEYRAGGRLRIRQFFVGMDWFRYTNSGSRMGFFVGGYYR